MSSHYVERLLFWGSSFPILPVKARRSLLRLLGCKVGDGTMVSPFVFVGSKNVSFGKHCFVNVGVFLDGAGEIEIQDYARIGPYARFLTATHEIWPSPLRRHREGIIKSRTVVGRGSWIGMGAQVLPGVNIGTGCVIAAGALVTADTEPNCLYAGIPARRVKELPVTEGAEQEVLQSFGETS